MLVTFVLLLCSILLIKADTSECGPNEQLVNCDSCCPSDYCPTSDGQNGECSEPKPCFKTACQCTPLYRRAVNGTCILAQDCPPFDCNGPYEQYDSCPNTFCSEECSSATPDGKCPHFFGIGPEVICSPMCRCIKYHWRNNGACVPYAECPNVNSAGNYLNEK